jgi:tetratricopeptide (TPR) repeat protein
MMLLSQTLLPAISRVCWQWPQLRVLLLGASLWLGSSVLLWAQGPSLPTSPAIPEGFSANQLIEFAEQLQREGEYFRAITEYRRFLFYFPQDPRQAIVHFRIGLAFYRGQSYAEALQTFREVAQRYPETVYGRQAWLWQGECLMRQAQYGVAEQVYAEALKQFGQEEIGQLARYQRGWTLLYRGLWRDASAQFQHVSPESSLYHVAQHLAEESLEGEQLPRKSPLIAGILSGVLPGSGQLYNGRLGDALLAFFLNGLFVTGIVEAIEHREFAVAGILSFFEAGWYTGNIYGAANGAYKQNRYVVDTFLRNLENRFRVQPPEAHRPQSLGIRLSFDF